jgi:hypothetical protein
VNYRREDSSGDRRKIKRFGEGIIPDRRNRMHSGSIGKPSQPSQPSQPSDSIQVNSGNPPSSPGEISQINPGNSGNPGNPASQINQQHSSTAPEQSLQYLQSNLGGILAELKNQIIQELTTPKNHELAPQKNDSPKEWHHEKVDPQNTQYPKEIKTALTKKRGPGRPSALPPLEHTDEWPRKTYRFNKENLRLLKQLQNNLEEHKDLSILIDEAISEYLKQNGYK